MRVSCVGSCALLLVATACGGDASPDGRPTDAVSVRDSAGIEIVSSEAPVWAEDEGWTIGEEPLFVIPASEGDDETGLLDPTSIDVDERGRIIVGDGNQVGWDAILVYDETGDFLFRAGGPGEGPGEFGQLWWARSYRGDSLAAFDMSRDQLVVFDGEGRYARQVRIPPISMIEGPARAPGYSPWVDGVFSDGDILAYATGGLDVSDGPGPVWYLHPRMRLRPDGESWDTLGIFRIQRSHWTGSEQRQLWFGPVTVSTAAGEVMWYGEAESFELQRWNAEGRIDRIVRRAWEPRLVTEEHRDAVLTWYLDLLSSSPEGGPEVEARVRRQLAQDEYAETLPPYASILVDSEGHLWVEEFAWFGMWIQPAPIAGPRYWSVFDPDGVWLGRVRVPSGLHLRAVTADRALGFAVDDFGVKELHVYPLDRGVG